MSPFCLALDLSFFNKSYFELCAGVLTCLGRDSVTCERSASCRGWMAFPFLMHAYLILIHVERPALRKTLFTTVLSQNFQQNTVENVFSATEKVDFSDFIIIILYINACQISIVSRRARKKGQIKLFYFFIW